MYIYIHIYKEFNRSYIDWGGNVPHKSHGLPNGNLRFRHSFRAVVQGSPRDTPPNPTPNDT